MARSNYCVDMHIKYIRRRSNCLILYFGTSKGNQTTERDSDPCHVYSKPKDPTICPVLALGKYLSSNPDILTTNSPLFMGNCQYKRFLKYFTNPSRTIFDIFQPLRVEKEMLGAHSIRKGAITIVDTGWTISPPMTSICLRTDWSIGPIKYWYIHYKKAGDQFVGRSVTGISSLRKYFGMSPVHWDWTDSYSKFKG